MGGQVRRAGGRPELNGNRQVARLDPVPAAQVVAAAGTAVVTAAKVGRLLTRSGWGLARRLPGGQALQREVQRLQDAAVSEVRRALDLPDGGAARGDHNGGNGLRGANREEQRVMMLVQQSDNGHDPLRSAMAELLERSVETDRSASRDYLYGNIISQLVPDEARILSALADGTPYATLDVVVKQLGRSTTRTVLANMSSVGRAAGVAVPENVPTYVDRLYRFGLVEFGASEDSLSVQYDILATDAVIQAAQATVEAARQGSPKLVRKTLRISAFGRQFWAACDPARPSLSGSSG